MSRSRKLTHLQKSKRIRKNKKDFLRGKVQTKPTKITTESTVIPLQYVLLFCLFITTIIGYVSLTFLVSKIQINSNIYNEARSSLPTIQFPSIHLPHLSIPMPHIPIPGIDTARVTKPIGNIIARLVAILLQYGNPIPYWTNVFAIASQAIWIGMVWIALHINHIWTQLIKTLQTNGTAFLREIHPAEILQTTLSAITSALLNSAQWIGRTGSDYLSLLGNGISTSITVVGNSITRVLITILQLTGIVTIALATSAQQHIAFLYQTILFAMAYTAISLENLQIETTTLLLNILLVILHGVITGILYLVQGIELLFKGIMFVLASIGTAILHMGIAIINWCISILTAIRKWLDATLGAIGAFIHLGDPLYNVIGESVGNLVSGMGEAFSVTAKAIQGGKLE